MILVMKIVAFMIANYNVLVKQQQYLGLEMDIQIVRSLIILVVIYHVIIMMAEIVEKLLVILMQMEF